MRAECGACGYSVSHLKVGDARHDIAACSNCSEIVNAVYFPFRPLEPICCPTCHSELPSEVFLFSNQPGPLHPCPRCGKSELGFKTEMHFSMRMPEPELGERVQARTLTSGIAVLAGSLCPLEGRAESLVWVEAIVGEESLIFQRVLQPWLSPRQKFVHVEVAGQRAPWLRLDLAAVVRRFSADSRSAWLDYRLMAEPFEARVQLDETRHSLVVELPDSRPELESYLSCLAERFEAIGGKLFHEGDWQPARLVQAPDAFELRALDGSCLDRLSLPQ